MSIITHLKGIEEFQERTPVEGAHVQGGIHIPEAAREKAGAASDKLHKTQRKEAAKMLVCARLRHAMGHAALYAREIYGMDEPGKAEHDNRRTRVFSDAEFSA